MLYFDITVKIGAYDYDGFTATAPRAWSDDQIRAAAWRAAEEDFENVEAIVVEMIDPLNTEGLNPVALTALEG